MQATLTLFCQTWPTHRNPIRSRWPSIRLQDPLRPVSRAILDRHRCRAGGTVSKSCPIRVWGTAPAMPQVFVAATKSRTGSHCTLRPNSITPPEVIEGLEGGYKSARDSSGFARYPARWIGQVRDCLRIARSGLSIELHFLPLLS